MNGSLENALNVMVWGMIWNSARMWVQGMASREYRGVLGRQLRGLLLLSWLILLLSWSWVWMFAMRIMT